MRSATALFVVTAALLVLAGPAHATDAVYDYGTAKRERVFIPQPGIDQDGNGTPDKVTIDIIRPLASGPANKMPAIVVPSPYLTSTCIGRADQCLGDMDGDGVNDHWPLFLDNYFVPRGYAVIYAQMNGTGNTTDGCPNHGGPGDIAGEKSVIDWLNGRTPGVDKDGAAATAAWHNGSSAMIGKSYDGTLANGVAATGVAGLKTIVPIAAISDWYAYSRSNGVRTVGTNYPSGLNKLVTYAAGVPGVSLPDRRPICATVNAGIDGADGDETGDRNAFWDARNYAVSAANVHAAVFAVHGFQDDNVTMDQLWPWWNGLASAGVTRKLWLLRSGHTDPFDSRRAVWVDTLHRWFDHWLYGVDNGVEDEPPVTIEDEKDVWGEYGAWPVPGTTDVDVYLRATTATDAGVLRATSGGPLDSVSFTNTAQAAGATLAASVETGAITTPEGSQAARRVFLSPPLATDLRLSGRAVVSLRAGLSTTQSNLGAVIVDYGAGSQVTRSGDGVQDTADPPTCWGVSSAYDTACFKEPAKPVVNVTQWRVTRGILDSSNRASLSIATPVTIGQAYDYSIPATPTEHTFKAGHRIGVVLVGNLYGIAGTAGAAITVDTKLSKVALPIAGGAAAALASGLTDEAAPASSASVSPAPNAAGWVRAKPTVTLTAADGAGSGVKEITYATGGGAPETVAGAAAQVHVTAEGETTIRYFATDRAGNAEAERTVTVDVDTVAPSAACPADASWHAANVTVACGPVSLTTAVAAGAESAAATAARAVCDAAGNCTTATLRRKIDRRAPAVTITFPATTEFARGAVVAVAHTCTDGGSGVVSCTGTARLDTGAAGPHELVVTARDAVGNSRTERRAYTVLGSVPKPRVSAKRVKGGIRLTLTSRLGGVVRITGPGVRAARVQLAPGVARTVKVKAPRRKLTLRLATSAGALHRADRVTVR